MFTLTVVTPEKIVFKEPVKSLIAPGVEGYLEILKDHASLITVLKEGEFTITNEQGHKSLYAISGGVLVVHHNDVKVLADAIEKAPEIDVKRAKQADLRAKKRLETLSEESEEERERAKHAHQRAATRLKVKEDAEKKDKG